jgi:hypothetical protein
MKQLHKRKKNIENEANKKLKSFAVGASAV